MQSPRWLTVALSAALLAALALLVACGGGGSGDKASNNPDVVPTATLPASLPEPVILGESQAPTGGGTTYTVLDGDTLSSIAAQYGVSVEELMAANNITDPASLVAGQVLTIPGSNPPQASNPTPVPPQPTTPPAQETPSTDGQQTYTVQEGDYPESIAAQFGITAGELMAANGITDPTSLHVGDVLIIPAPSGG